jgi:hypothetical protein
LQARGKKRLDILSNRLFYWWVVSDSNARPTD